jgi:hypothetical protein
MGSVHGEEGIPANWRGWYGYIPLGDIEPYCVIDSLTYGVGTRSFYVGSGGRREYGIRPLWPDEAKLRDYAGFYKELQESIAEQGVLTPVLLYRISGKLYCRYGASRLWVLSKLDRVHVPAIVCDFSREDWSAASYVELKTPAQVVDALGRPRYIGTFEVSHERIDLHNVVPSISR